MGKKKQLGGLTSPNLIQPGDQILNQNNLIDTTLSAESVLKEFGTELTGGLSGPYGQSIKNVDYTSYDKYIDRPFSFISDDADDLRAYNQSFGEKAAHGLPKFVTRVGTNVLGSTVGLLYGGGAFLGGLAQGKGIQDSGADFFDNSFQRGLDGINDWMDGKLPHFYTKEEQEHGFFKGMGTANFWFNDFSQGASFVTGAVLSEMLTAGMASSAVASKAAQLMNKMGRGTGLTKKTKFMKTGTGKTAIDEGIDATIKSNQWKNAGRTMRQIGTGAMYEAGVEARHHRDQTIDKLHAAFKDEYHRDPNSNEAAYLYDLATKSANSVFAANTALVGYGNYLMFPKIFGKGFNATQKSVAGKFKQDIKNKVQNYKALYKDVSKKRAFTNNAWRVLKTPLYEGFVEEGGQKLADLAGQSAAEYYYQSKRDPGFLGMTTELLNHTDNVFAEAYGSPEGQKEIGIGFLLAAIGLPGYSRSIKDGTTGKTKSGYKHHGGIAGTLDQIKMEKKMIDSYERILNEDENVISAIAAKTDALVRAGVIQDASDFGQIMDSPYMKKNAEYDNLHNYISSRLDAGYEETLRDDIDMIRNMSVQQFRNAFHHNDLNDLTNTELKDKQSELANSLEEEINTIKATTDKVNKAFVNYDTDVKRAMIHAWSMSKNAYAREEDMYKSIEEKMKAKLNIQGDVESRTVRDEREDISLKERIKRLWSRFTKKQKREILALPESKTLLAEKNIREFTDPTHIEELFLNLTQELKSIESQIEALETDGIEAKNAFMGGTTEQQTKWAKEQNLEQKHAELFDKTQKLGKAIEEGLEAEIGADEQALLDAWKDRDAADYALHKDEVIQMLKDARKLRARRHRAINMYNELLDYREDAKMLPLGKFGIPQYPFAEHGQKVPLPKILRMQMIPDEKEENAENITDIGLKRLFKKYTGQIIEFEYARKDTTTKKGLLQIAREAGLEEKVLKDAEDIKRSSKVNTDIAAIKMAMQTNGLRVQEGPKTGKYRVFVRTGKPSSNSDNFLIDFPTKETLELLTRKRTLERLPDNQAAKDELKEINELLKTSDHVNRFNDRNLDFLKQAKNIKVVDKAVQIQEYLDVALNASKKDLHIKLDEIEKELSKHVEDAELLSTELIKASTEKSNKASQRQLAKSIRNLDIKWQQAERAIEVLEIDKEEVKQKLKDVTNLTSAINKSEDIPGFTDPAFHPIILSKAAEFLNSKWLDHKEVIDQFVDKKFFKEVDLFSDIMTEDTEKNKDLAELIFSFATNPAAELPAELANLLDKKVEHLKYKYEQAQPLLKKLRSLIVFRKTKGNENQYDLRYDQDAAIAAYEDLKNEVDLLKVKYDAAVNALRSKINIELLPLAQGIADQQDLGQRYNAIRDLFAIYATDTNNALRSVTETPFDEVTTGEIETHSSEMSEEEFIKTNLNNNQNTKPRVYYNSPSLIHIGGAKTAGSHAYAERRIEELENEALNRDLTSWEQEALAAYKHQAIFFDFTARAGVRSKAQYNLANYSLMTITRHNIPTGLKDKVYFYDHNRVRAAKTENKDRYSKATNENFTNAKARPELKETILLVVVDKNNNPVIHNGEVVYTSMPDSEAYTTVYDKKTGEGHRVYKYGRADLNLENGTVPSIKINGALYFQGDMSEQAVAINEQNKKFRERILTLPSGEVKYLAVSGKSAGLQIWVDGPDGRAMARETLVKREEDVQNIDLRVAVNAKTQKVSIGPQEYTVHAGNVYAVHNGNLVRFKMPKLPAKMVSNVYNLIRLLATQVTNSYRENSKFTPETAYLIPGTEKSITKQISELIYYGKHARTRENQQYAIYTQGNVLYFGAQSMTFEQLADKAQFAPLHKDLLNFLQDQRVQVNNAALKDDQEIRLTHRNSNRALYAEQKAVFEKVYKQKQAWIKKGRKGKFAPRLGKEEKTLYNKKESRPKYNTYKYYEVGEKLNVLTSTWNNYTHFLMGTKAKEHTVQEERQLPEIPLTVNMRPDTDTGKKSSESWRSSQYRNIYLIYSPNASDPDNWDTQSINNAKIEQSAEELGEVIELTDEQEDQLFEDQTTMDNLDPNMAPSGVITGKQYIYTSNEGVKLHFKVTSIDHENFKVMLEPIQLSNNKGILSLDTLSLEVLDSFNMLTYVTEGKALITPVKQDVYEQKHQTLDDIKKSPKKKKRQKRNKKKTDDNEDYGGKSRLALMSEDYRLMDLYAENEKFEAMIPKDRYGKPIFSVKVVAGLIHGRDWGYFSKTGDILLSSEAERGTLYHEAYHGITLKLLSKEERETLYNEVRAQRGKATTYKGEVKSLKDFTNLEADEWLAEEFREYVIADGTYKVGSRVKKSFMDKVFDFLLKFFRNLSQSKALFHRIHTGYYNNGIEEYLSYDIAEALEGREGASMSAYRMQSGVQRDLNNGVTVSVFDIIQSKTGVSIPDLIGNKHNEAALRKILTPVYGAPGTKNTAWSRMHNSINTQLNILIDEHNQAMDESEMPEATELDIQRLDMKLDKLEVEIESLEQNLLVLDEDWPALVSRNLQVLQQLHLQVNSRTLEDEFEEVEEEDTKSRDTLGIRDPREINLKSTIDPGLRVLLSTLPQSHVYKDGSTTLKTNKAGVPTLAPFGEVVTTLYKQLANLDTVEDIVAKLRTLAEENRTYKILIDRLGLQHGLEGLSSHDPNFNQVSMLIDFLGSFHNASDAYVMLLANQTKAENHPGRYFTNSNTERVENIVKRGWSANFKRNLRLKRNKGKSTTTGRLVLNLDYPVTIRTKGIKRTETLRKWIEINKNLNQIIPLLNEIGLEFTNLPKLIKNLNASEGGMAEFIENANWFFSEILDLEGDMSNLFGGDVEGNLKKLVRYEVDSTNLAITLQHTNPDGKQLFGITRKNYINLLVDKLNTSEEEIESLMESPYMHGSLYNKERVIKVRTIEGGKDITKGQGFDISRTTEANIALLHVNSILEGYTPLLRPGNKKMERAVMIGQNKYRNREEMISYLQDLLRSEIVTANNIKNDPSVRQISRLRTHGESLQFFNDPENFPDIYNHSRVLSFINAPNVSLDDVELQNFVGSSAVVKNITDFLDTRQTNILAALEEFGFIGKGPKNTYINIGIDNVHVEDANKSLATPVWSKNGKMDPALMNRIVEKISYNQLIGVVEQTRLFLGHPALYSDIFKRTSGMVGTKKYPTVNNHILSWMNTNMPNKYTNKEHTSLVTKVTRKEIIQEKSAHLDSYIKRLNELNASEELKKDVTDRYSNMEIFDGGGFITLDFYRSVLFLTHNWTNEMEEAYQELELINEDQPTLADLGSRAIFPPLKPQVFADSRLGMLNIKIFDKFALYPIHPKLSKTIMGLKSNAVTVMDQVYDDMVKNEVDYMVFQSSSKVGAKTNSKGEFEPFYDVNGNYQPLSADPDYLQTYDLEYFGIQLDPAKKYKGLVRVGTQSASMSLMNVFDKGLLNKDYNKQFDKNRTWEDVASEFHNIHTALIEKDAAKLAAKLGFIKGSTGYTQLEAGTTKQYLKQAVLDEMHRRNTPEVMRDTIEELFNGEIYYTNQLPNKQKIDELFYSIVTSEVIHRKVNGEMSVLQSDTGFRTIQADKQLPESEYRQLKFYDFEKDGKTVTAMEVYLPHYFKQKFLTTSQIDISQFTPAALELIGFRIPTEGLNSVEFIKVVGFLPQSAGPNVIAPAEMVAKSGADYDIDKLTLYLPHLVKSEDGNIDIARPADNNATSLRLLDAPGYKAAAIKLFGSDIAGLNNFIRRLEIADQLEANMQHEDALKELAELDTELDLLGFEALPQVFKENREVVENMLQSLMKDILRHPDSFAQLIAPVGAFNIKRTSDEIHSRQLAAGIEGVTAEPSTLFEKFSLRSLIRTTYQMHQTLGGTGIVATNLTHLGKSQRAGLEFKGEIPLYQSGIPIGTQVGPYLNFEGFTPGQPVSLSSVKDTAGNYINRSMQQYVTAYVDGEKDPFIMYVNGGRMGAGVHMLLVRAGVPVNTVLKFMSQPVLQEYFSLKNKQSVAGATTPYGEGMLNEGKVVSAIQKMLGKANKEEVPLNEAVLDDPNPEVSMLTTPLAKMGKGQKALQAQIFNDFLRYKEYAEYLRKAQQISAFDTSRLKNGYELIFLNALEQIITEDTESNPLVFNNLNGLTGFSRGVESLGVSETVRETPPFLQPLKQLFTESPQFFKNTDLKENIVLTQQNGVINPFKAKMIQLAKDLIAEGKSKDEITYILRALDNHLTSFIWQNIPRENMKSLNDKEFDLVRMLMQGPNSLPARVFLAKDIFPDNLLVQDLIATLDTETDITDFDHTVDKLQLFSRKYDPDEIDDLADSWYELHNSGGVGQQLAEDILLYSIIKSGTQFHPSSFFHALPGAEVLRITNPMLQNFHDAIHRVAKGTTEYLTTKKVEEIVADFFDHSWDNPRVVRQIFATDPFLQLSATEEQFAAPNWLNDERITLIVPRDEGEVKGIATEAGRTYFKAHFQRRDTVYVSRPKKGLAGHLQEPGREDSIIESNNHPFGREKLKMTESVVNTIRSRKKSLLSYPYGKTHSGVKILPDGTQIKLDLILDTPYKYLFVKANMLKFGALNKTQMQGFIARREGYKNWSEFAKAPRNKNFIKGEERKSFFDIKVLDAKAIMTARKDAPAVKGYDPSNITDLKTLNKDKEC